MALEENTGYRGWRQSKEIPGTVIWPIQNAFHELNLNTFHFVKIPLLVNNFTQINDVFYVQSC